MAAALERTVILSRLRVPPHPGERSGAERTPARSGWINDPARAAAMSPQLLNVFILKSSFVFVLSCAGTVFQVAQSAEVSWVVLPEGLSSLAGV
jgi:hypothetical protein